MFGTNFSSVGAQSVVGAVLGCDSVFKLVVGVEGEDGGDVEGDWSDDDIWVRGLVPTLLGLNLMFWTVFLTKLTASWAVKLDFQLPAIIRLFLENRLVKQRLPNIRYISNF